MIIFTFKNKNDFDKAVSILKKAIDTLRTSHFDFSYQPQDKTIMISEKNAHIVEGWLNRNNVEFTINRGYGKYAMIRKIISRYISSSKKVIRKKKISEKEYDLCPHCGQEIGEKQVFYDKNNDQWYHSVCSGPIEFSEPDYTQYDETWLTSEQLQIRAKQLKNKQLEGKIFYFRIKTFGDTDNPDDFIKCHSECEYLADGNCILFKKDLKKDKKSELFVRSPECLSAVEGLI